jgi:hypothetical protein
VTLPEEAQQGRPKPFKKELHMETIERIALTEKHIQKGYRCSASYGPIALAIREQHPKINIVLYSQDITIGAFRYRLTPEAQEIIHHHDAGGDMDPATVEIDHQHFTLDLTS